MKKYGKGWHGESYAHGLCAKGIKLNRNKSSKGIDYLEVHIAPTKVTTGEPTEDKQLVDPSIDVSETVMDITDEQFKTLPEEDKKKLLEAGWVGRGLEAEGKFVGGVAKGLIGTTLLGISGLPDEPEESRRTNFAKKTKKVRTMKKQSPSTRLAHTIKRFVNRNVSVGKKLPMKSPKLIKPVKVRGK